MTVLYDSIRYNRRMLLDLPFREGIGVVTQDVAKPHHPITMIDTPTWAALDSGKMTINLNGTTQYLQCLNASCADLGFTTGDYSVGCWFKVDSTGDDSQILIGRYALNIGGWELYHYSTGLMTMRHHHAGGAAVRSACYSAGWAYGTLYFLGFSRIGSVGIFYRNGVELATIGVLEDPEATTSDLVIGARYTKNDNFYKGPFPRLIVTEEALTAEDWMSMYKHQVGYAS